MKRNAHVSIADKTISAAIKTSTTSQSKKLHLGHLKKKTRGIVRKAISDLDNTVLDKFVVALSKDKITVDELKASIKPIGGELVSSTIKEGKKGIKPKKNDKTIDRRTLPKPLREAYKRAIDSDDQERMRKIEEMLSRPEAVSAKDWEKIVELDKKKPLVDRF